MIRESEKDEGAFSGIVETPRFVEDIVDLDGEELSQIGGGDEGSGLIPIPK